MNEKDLFARVLQRGAQQCIVKRVTQYVLLIIIEIIAYYYYYHCVVFLLLLQYTHHSACTSDRLTLCREGNREHSAPPCATTEASTAICNKKCRRKAGKKLGIGGREGDTDPPSPFRLLLASKSKSRFLPNQKVSENCTNTQLF